MTAKTPFQPDWDGESTASYKLGQQISWSVLSQDLVHIHTRETETCCQQSTDTKLLRNKKAFIIPRAATAGSLPCFPAGGRTRCLLPFFTLQVVQKVCLFIGNVAVAFACFCSLFSKRPGALCCKLKLFSGFSPGCSAPFSSL